MAPWKVTNITRAILHIVLSALLSKSQHKSQTNMDTGAIIETNVEAQQPDKNEYLIIGKNIKKYFEMKIPRFLMSIKVPLKAVDGVNIAIKKGEVIGLVGESGCGKTTLGRLLINLIPPTDGELYFEPPAHIVDKIMNGKKLTNEELHKYSMFHFSNRKMKKFRKNMQIVFQDPYSSLDPRYLLKDIIAEPLQSYGMPRVKAYELAKKLLREVGLPEDFINRFPHQLSGGQRQRVAIARALALNPKFLVLDEPTSALDVSVQAQILNLLRDLKEKYNLTMLFISHHIIVIRHVSTRIFVMYLGKILEIAETEALFAMPLHPYTQALLSAVPVPDPKSKRERIILVGDVPSPINPPRGCRFHTRCKFAFEKCGWSANEVVDAVHVIYDSTRNTELVDFPKIVEIKVENENTLRIVFEQPIIEKQLDVLKSVIEKEKKKSVVRAIFGIKDLEFNDNNVMVYMHEDVKEPELHDIGSEHYVACWLYTEK